MVLPDSDVCVTIPPGAVSQGRNLDLFLSVIHHARPLLGPRETLLSPLVCIGPREAAVQLKKAVILTLPHCASLRHGHWRISLLQSEAECFHNDNDHLRPWSRTVTLGQETLNTPAYVQVNIITEASLGISPRVVKLLTDQNSRVVKRLELGSYYAFVLNSRVVN